MAPDLGLLEASDHVGASDVTDVDPERHGALGRDGLAPLALEQVDGALVGSVDAVEAGEVVDDGADDQGRVNGDEVEAGLLLLDKVPGGLLGELLGDAVGGRGGAVDVGGGVRVPAVLGEGVVRVGEVGLVDDGGEGGGYDDAADLGRRLLEGLEDAGCAVDGGVKEFLLGVTFRTGGNTPKC